MKSVLIYFVVFVATALPAFAYNNIWKQHEGRVPTKGTRELNPERYLVYHLDNEYMKQQLFSLSSNPASGMLIDLPAPDGSFKKYKIWEQSNMDPVLAAKFPEIKSFTGYDINNKGSIAVLDFSPRGFDAMILNGDETYLIDPYSNVNDGYYLCYYKSDYKRPAGKELQCGVQDDVEDELNKGRLYLTKSGLPDIQKITGGTIMHSYRLALACTGEYAKAVGGASPTKATVLAAMNTSINRINAVYRSEAGIEMILIANNEDLIFLDGSTDPFTTKNPDTMMTENQAYTNTNIGAANYDMGHVFDAGSGNGKADLGVICKNADKARGVSGQVTPVGDVFDIDFVAHEMGHQFNAKHTFNASSSQCGNNNGAFNSAYEPGSGSTIMAYAGICTINDLQQHSDDYFHAHSLDQIAGYVAGVTCGTTNPSTNTPASVGSFNNTFFIPYQTPFELTAPTATDADHDALTYCWEEMDLGDFGADFIHTVDGPIFRSFKATASETRVFPQLDMIRNNITFYLGEKLPASQRVMKFKLTVRDILNGWGIFNTPSDEITLQVVNTGTPFSVSAPNTASDYWQVNSTVDVKWDVANTNAAPINTTGVDIYLSLDDGQTYPIILAQNVPNTGTASVTVPADAFTASARVKVKGASNVFFDISNAGFIINQWPASVKQVSWADDVKLYPVPADDILNIQIDNSREYSVSVSNALGQQVLMQTLSKTTVINTGSWTAGFYNLQLTDVESGERLVKRVIVR